MPLYCFHQEYGVGVTEDPEGSELPDLFVARESAVQGARELLANADVLPILHQMKLR